MNYTQAERSVFELLTEKLSPSHLYHSIDHTKDVIESAERIGTSEKVSEKEMLLLKTAALFHDTGFTEQYEHNEPIGCRIAQERLPAFGYDAEAIARICDIVMATDLRNGANDLLHEIIRDADLDYLGRDDFFRISGNLRKELQAHGTSFTDKDWYIYQVKFMEDHFYNTLSSKADRQTGKQKNLDQLKKMMKLGQY